MKPIFLITACAASLAFAATAASAADVEIKDTVARVVVIPEDRTDIAIEIEQGSAGLPQIQLRRRGNDVEIRGGIRSRDIRNCSGQAENVTQPGQGATVEVRGRGRISMTDAPLIVVRTPRATDVSVQGAVFGSVGRGATSISLSNAGCGAWTVANTPGELDLSVAGSGPVRAGTSGSLDLSVAGSGDVTVGATGAADIAVAGSGDVRVAAINGNLDVAIAGSGDVRITRGTAPVADISIAGSGGVDFGGEAGNLDVSIVGSGDVRMAAVTGNVSRSIIGSGDVRIGR
jgi:hypothetical protein